MASLAAQVQRLVHRARISDLLVDFAHSLDMSIAGTELPGGPLG